MRNTCAAWAFFLFLFSVLPGFGQDADQYVTMADEKMQQGDFSYALVLVEKAIKLEPGNDWLKLKRSEILGEWQGPGPAIAYLYGVIRKSPKFAEAYNRMGNYYSSYGNVDSAIYCLNKAIDLAANDTARYSYIGNRGAAKVSHRDFTGAMEDYLEVLKFDSADVGILNNLGHVYGELKRYADAEHVLNRVIEIDSTMIGGFVNLGFMYSNIDSQQLAIQYFNRALNIDPNDAHTYNNRGYSFYKLGLYDKALKDINLAIKLYPTNPYAYRNLALLFLATQNKKEACTAIDYALYYGFTQYYGTEVLDLQRQHCLR